MPVELLQVIAQPCYSSRLRYRSDYERNQTRQGTLRSENNPNYSSPAIQVRNSILHIRISVQNYTPISLDSFGLFK